LHNKFLIFKKYLKNICLKKIDFLSAILVKRTAPFLRSNIPQTATATLDTYDFIIICALVRGSNSFKLNYCSEENDKVTIRKNSLMYLDNFSPEPYPTILNTVVRITDIVDVNTESNTMTIFADTYCLSLE
jgi:hypothetical protein